MYSSHPLTKLAASAMLLAGGAYASQACLACRRQDINAGFMVQYSFCAISDECVQDVWNYFNRNCSSEW